MTTTALVLLSGGLDSLLACRVLMAQGIRVVALRFTAPFFDADVGDPADYRAKIMAKYGIDARVHDVSRDYVRMLAAPAHGFGRNFNPCIDCKILMLRRARELMPEYGASLLATGEVLGQRPMSQRRDAMRIIEKESGCAGLLLRPLCALHMEPTEAERAGLVDRTRLLGLSGRGRTEQQRLAAEFGITDYPAPAGGCLLTDVNLTVRFRRFAPGLFAAAERRGDDFLVDSFRLLLFGRHFEPAPGLWFVLGRDQRDNDKIERLREPGDILFQCADRPGPLGLLRVLKPDADAETLYPTLAGLVLRYAKKTAGRAGAGIVRIERDGAPREARFAPLDDEAAQALQVI